ncbi:pyridoxamine 5'-phosphate oxidase family protein [Mangrovivirga sp. M17]|uniref:Pyridoxamine 5'-phosphate oxidase family protein n=1 Tax=Mangrovivirga halotolerans TaxID=2993936 RepID=A0ABT3RUP0_9BACT|nr:pyridoxamine 5'-phosphate oxidase family protein [Mangrovivirga halotolerans]MCX2745484.1 pyridoxamine 5'-phosphate oxidase family protein [Mangrovivirga halotolerans]
MSSPEHKQKIWNLIKDIKVGMLVTQEDNGSERLRARPMSLVQDAYDGTLYFYTPKSDAKVYEIKNDRDVCITFSDPENQVYVSLTGKAKLTQDKELIDKYWNAWASAWFKEGKDDPEVAMLEVKINKGEHWVTDENKILQLYEVAKANIKEESVPDMGENEKFGN